MTKIASIITTRKRTDTRTVCRKGCQISVATKVLLSVSGPAMGGITSKIGKGTSKTETRMTKEIIIATTVAPSHNRVTISHSSPTTHQGSRIGVARIVDE